MGDDIRLVGERAQFVAAAPLTNYTLSTWQVDAPSHVIPQE